jgi:hypothetical protein
MSKRPDYIETPSKFSKNEETPFSKSQNYCSDESRWLIYCESTKLNTTESSKKEYPIYELQDEATVNELTQSESSKTQEKINTTPVIHHNSWSFPECYALLEGIYDPRNFGRVSSKNDRVKELSPNIKKDNKSNFKKRKEEEVFASVDSDALEL